MGDDSIRYPLIENINRAFSAENIAATRQRLVPLSPRADVFEILDRLGLMGFVPNRDLPRYRRSVGIPRLIQRVLTQAFRTSLLNRPHPIPLQIDIVGRNREAAAIEFSPNLISVVLTRTI
jgi:hypothetical protein